MADEKTATANSTDVDPNTGGAPNQIPTSTVPYRQQTKGRLALGLAVGILITFSLLPFIALVTRSTNIEGFKDMVLGYGSVLAGPLSIIIYNYFREGDNT